MRRRRRRGGGRRGQPPTPEQQAAQREAAERLRAWRTSVSMDRFKALRKMFNDAGVTIYAWKQLSPNMSDGEMEYVFDVAEALGCTHTTLELIETRAAQTHRPVRGEEEDLRGLPHAPAGQHDGVRSGVRGVEGQHGERGPRSLRRRRRRPGRVHHEVQRPDLQRPPEGSHDPRERTAEPTVGNRRHAAEGDPADDETGTAHVPASIELEYEVPSGSDAVKETAKCLDFCKAALAMP